MGREVRRVPKDWEHPKEPNGDYIPLYGRSYSQDLNDWLERRDKWEEGLVRDYDYKGNKIGWKPLPLLYEGISFEEWDGDRPRFFNYMPDWSEEEKTHWQMYECVTEGTPLSPVMENPEELARWLSDNEADAGFGTTASYEEWLTTIQKGWATSFLVSSERGVISGVSYNTVKEGKEDDD